MMFCLICKEIIDDRYNLNVKDTKLNVDISGHVCRHCFKKFIESHYDKGFFGISKYISWVKERADSMRK